MPRQIFQLLPPTRYVAGFNRKPSRPPLSLAWLWFQCHRGGLRNAENRWPQADATERLYAEVRKPLVTPLRPYGELFGDVAIWLREIAAAHRDV